MVAAAHSGGDGLGDGANRLPGTATDSRGSEATTDGAVAPAPQEFGVWGTNCFCREERVHFGSLLQTVGVPLRPFYPVHGDLLAPQILARLGFTPETTTLGRAYDNFVATECRSAVGLLEALKSLGVDPAHAVLTTKKLADTPVCCKLTSNNGEFEFYFSANGKKLTVNAESLRGDEQLLRRLKGDDGRLSREFRVLEGVAREFIDHPTWAEQTLGAYANSQVRAVVDGELFWNKIVRGELGVEDALLAHILDSDIGSYAARERFGVMTGGGGALGPIRTELAGISRELEAAVKPTAITDPVVAKEVAERLVAFREGTYRFPHQVNFPHGTFIGTMRWERERGLFDPIVADAPDTTNAKRPVAVLLQERMSGTGPDAWKPALRDFYNAQCQIGKANADRAEAVLRFAMDCLFPYVDQTPGHFIPGKELVDRYLAPLMEEGQGRTWAYYYGFFKTHSVMRTGSQSAAVGPAEYEILRSLAGVALACKERLNVPLKFVVVDEASAVAELSGVHNLGVTRPQVTTNHAMARKYLELIGAGGVVEVRNFPGDLRAALGTAEFERARTALTADQSKKQALPLHRLYILVSAVPMEYLTQLGLSRADVVDLYARHLQGGRGPGGEFTRADIPARVLDAIEETAFQFDALMQMREAAKKAALGVEGAPPQFLPGSVSLGVTHATSRLSICPTPRFMGTATLPLHGIPVYGGGEYLGNVQLWRIAANPELFRVYVDPEGNPSFAGFRLAHRSVELYKERKPLLR